MLTFDHLAIFTKMFPFISDTLEGSYAQHNTTNAVPMSDILSF